MTLSTAIQFEIPAFGRAKLPLSRDWQIDVVSQLPTRREPRPSKELGFLTEKSRGPT